MRLSTGERVFSTTRVICTGHAPLVEGCLASLRELEDFRREVLAGTALVPNEIRVSVDDLVRVRMDRHRMIREGIL